MTKNNNNYFEIIVGTFVLLSAILFFIYSFNSANIKQTTGYQLIAKFENSDGISNGSAIKISGVKIGSVQKQYLDSNSFRAVTVLNINNNIKLPSDSSAKIISEGLLGSKYIAISPGSDYEMLSNGEEIIFTQASLNLEELLGKFIFSSDSKENNK